MPVIEPRECDHFIEVEGDPWAGTYCKLAAGHDGPHRAHYPTDEFAPTVYGDRNWRLGWCVGCSPDNCGGCGHAR